jgi:hypothetical protein
MQFCGFSVWAESDGLPPGLGLVSDLLQRLVCVAAASAERALRGVAVGRKNWTFAGSDAGGHRAAAVYTVIET